MDLNGFFQPSSIAIIGASRKEGSLGRVFFDNLLNYHYTGTIYPINPKAEEISGVRCYPDISAVPEIPAVAVILVRKDLAIEAVAACGEKGIENIVMITAGFKEVGGEGEERERQLLEVVRRYDMRMIGPNCMGVINTGSAIKMNASFSPTEPYPGNVAFISQSGALGVAVLEMSKALRLGFSIFVSEGNKADLSDSDFLEYLQTHEETGVVTLYQESIEDAQRFRAAAGQLSRKKPVIAIKAGRSASGARAASSHTGALASSDVATEALFKQCGILRADSVEELFDLSLAFSSQPIPGGKRVAVITNAGGPAILATDALERYGLQMASISEETQQKLRQFLPEEAAVKNPVDMIASANAETYSKTLKTVLRERQVDAVMVIIVRPPVNTTPRMIAESFRDILGKKPVFVVLMAQHDESCGLDIFQELKLPVYAYPESAARSIAAMLQYQDWRSAAKGKVRKFPVKSHVLHHIFEAAAAEGREHLRSQEINTILKTYGFPLPFSAVVQSPQEAVKIHRDLQKPLVLKIESDKIIHKSDIGGVRVNLDSPEKIEQAFREIMQNALKVVSGDEISGIFVQEMVSGGREVALGMTRDPNYGPLLMFGMGGIFVEVFKDVSFRLAPLTDRDAREMIAEIKGNPILQEFRGQPAVDTDLIVETIQRLSQLVSDWPQIAEMDLNPFVVSARRENCKIVDARIRLNL
ncbi:MAG: acetate--CoA ligase family protein [Calditrichia bacterium]